MANNNGRKLKDTKGITLIALAITIIVLLILAGISLSEVFSQDGIFRRAEQATNIYEKAKEKEEHILNNTIKFIDSTTNNKPHIESVRYLDRTDRTMKIKVMATDKDKENLTYTLFVGTTRENIEKYEETQEKEQGIEVEWEISVEDSKTKYYYKVEVKDQYATVDTGIKETNNAPIIGEINLEKNFDEKTGNWIKVTTSATDTENDEINFALKIWKKETGENEEDIVKNSPTKTEIKTNVLSGEEIEIVVNKLEEYKDYIYRVDIEDKENIVVGNRATIKTYCSGRGLECNDAIPCNVCNETGICNTTLSHYYAEHIGSGGDNGVCPICGQTGKCYNEMVHDRRCETCGTKPGFIYQNRACGHVWLQFENGDGTHRCNHNGSSSRKACIHGYFKKHEYCSHNKTGLHDD